MRITATECATATGFALPVAGLSPAPGENREICEAHLSLSRERKPRPARSLALLSTFLLAACAPTLHVDAPAMPALDTLVPTCTQSGTPVPAKEVLKLAALDPPPQLPDAERSPCPPGSGLAACFTPDQDAIRQQRFKILHDDRDYCRDAYGRAVTRSGGGAVK